MKSFDENTQTRRKGPPPAKSRPDPRLVALVGLLGINRANLDYAAQTADAASMATTDIFGKE